MARITKKELKGILKECLRELLVEEGLLAEGYAAAMKKNPAAAQDLIAPKQEDSSPSFNPRLKEHIDSLSGLLGQQDSSKADLMKQLLTDTAVTTLQAQLHAGDTESGGAIGNLVTEAYVSPEEKQHDEQTLKALSVDGDISRWAKVAFANNK